MKLISRLLELITVIMLSGETDEWYEKCHRPLLIKDLNEAL